MAGRAPNGEGSIYKRKSDGRWIGVVSLGFDEAGRQRRSTVSGKTRNVALTKIRELQRQLDEGLPPPNNRLTVGEMLDQWLKDVVPLRVSPSTLANYSSVVKTHIKPALGRKRLSTLTTDDVQAFISRKRDAGLSARTVRLLRGVLVQAIDQAQRKGKVPRNVAALSEGPRVEQGEKRGLTIDEAKILLKAVNGERLEALYLLMLSTGLRPGEAFGLTWSNVDLEKGLATIKQALSRRPGGNVIGEGKTGKKGWRTVNLPPPVVDSLLAHRKRQDNEGHLAGKFWQEHDLVFCTPVGTALDPDNHRRAFKTLVESAGLGCLSPNELRHSAATIMLAQGVPLNVVSKVLGHTSIRIAADVYGHTVASQTEAAAAAMATALWE